MDSTYAHYLCSVFSPATNTCWTVGRCKTCGEYIYKGKKFNARKETVQNELYMGLPIFRFYIKCTRCLAEITFKVSVFRSFTYSVELYFIYLFSILFLRISVYFFLAAFILIVSLFFLFLFLLQYLCLIEGIQFKVTTSHCLS